MRPTGALAGVLSGNTQECNMTDRLSNWYLALTIILLLDIVFLGFVYNFGAL